MKTYLFRCRTVSHLISNGGSQIFSIATAASTEARALVHHVKFLLLWLGFISMNLTSSFAWNIAMSGIKLLITTWICWTNYTSSYTQKWLCRIAGIIFLCKFQVTLLFGQKIIFHQILDKTQCKLNFADFNVVI